MASLAEWLCESTGYKYEILVERFKHNPADRQMIIKTVRRRARQLNNKLWCAQFNQKVRFIAACPWPHNNPRLCAYALNFLGHQGYKLKYPEMPYAYVCVDNGDGPSYLYTPLELLHTLH